MDPNMPTSRLLISNIARRMDIATMEHQAVFSVNKM